MPGMGSPSLSSFGLAAPFYHRVAIEALILAVVAFVLIAARFLLYGTAFRGAPALAVRGGDEAGVATLIAEPRARAVLRYGFGALWVLDGLLQLQSSMPTSMISQVIRPSEVGQPHWLVELMQWGTSAWFRHPIWSASGVIWVQIAIGLWLILGREGWFSKLGYLAAAGWGLFVWVFGEAMGQTFGHGGSWLFGAPGGVLFYVAAALVLLAPYAWWQRDKLPRWILMAVGAMLIVFGIQEALPGRGFWSFQIPQMVESMATVSQPGIIAASLRGFHHLLGANGGAVVNGITVAVLVIVGASFVLRKGLRITVPVFALFSVLVWWFIQDLGVLGGTGTDPNSMLPELLLVIVAVMGLSYSEALATQPAGFWPATLSQAGRLFGVWIVVLGLVGAVPLAYATVNTSYSIESALASSGAPFEIDHPAAGFTLLDQSGNTVSSSTFKGKTLIVTFLDPVCTDTCPLIASELREADEQLSPARRADTDVIAIAANPIFHSVRAVHIFTDREGMSTLPNWYFLTSPSLKSLATVWQNYGVGLSVPQNGVMVVHPDLVYIVNPAGVERWMIPADPSETSAVQSSFASLVDSLVKGVQH